MLWLSQCTPVFVQTFHLVVIIDFPGLEGFYWWVKVHTCLRFLICKAKLHSRNFLRILISRDWTTKFLPALSIIFRNCFLIWFKYMLLFYVDSISIYNVNGYFYDVLVFCWFLKMKSRICIFFLRFVVTYLFESCFIWPYFINLLKVIYTCYTESISN